MKTETRYLEGAYLDQNPDWHRADAPWKALLITKLLEKHNVQPKTICEIGCGSGEVLRCLQGSWREAQLFGYDVSPQVMPFWSEMPESIKLSLGDFFEANSNVYDVLLMLDVFEHVRDPITFLERSKRHAKLFVFHIPLDLSAASVVRGSAIVNVRRKVGHLSYYTKDLALEVLSECGFKILSWNYTGASMSSPARSLKTKLSAIPRRLLGAVNKDWSVRLLGGETLIVLAE